jgi:hypothetical protein
MTRQRKDPTSHVAQQRPPRTLSRTGIGSGARSKKPGAMARRSVTATSRNRADREAAAGSVEDEINRAFRLGEVNQFQRAAVAENLTALAWALRTCLSHEPIARDPDPMRDVLEAPRWLLDRAATVVDSCDTGERTGRRGRHARSATQTRDDIADLMRFRVVEWIRQRGATLDECFAEAAQRLSGTIGGGSEEAIARAYRRFKRRWNSEEGLRRYWHLFGFSDLPGSQLPFGLRGVDRSKGGTKPPD